MVGSKQGKVRFGFWKGSNLEAGGGWGIWVRAGTMEVERKGWQQGCGVWG